MSEEKPLLNRVIAVPEARQFDVLASLLDKRGAIVIRCPLVSIKDTPDVEPVLEWLKRFISSPPDLVIFYTGEGIERLLGFAANAGIEQQFIVTLAAVPKLTRGPKPKRALSRLDLQPEMIAPAPTTDGLVEALRSVELAGKRVAVQLYSSDQQPRLDDYLRERGATSDPVAPYVYADASDDQQVVALIEHMRDGAIDAIAFTSKAQVQRLLAVAKAHDLDDELKRGLTRTRIAAVGPVVGAELAEAGFAVDAMPEGSFSMKPLVSRLCELLGSGSP